jgi:hypothetical protein
LCLVPQHKKLMTISTRRDPAAWRIIRLFPAALGWLLFVYWWTRVAAQSTTAAATVAVAVLVVIAVSIFYCTLIWIRHNLKLAKRGKRGFSTRYLRPLFERDWLDRELVFRSASSARNDTWLVVHANVDQKRYSHHRLTAAGAVEREQPPA